MTGGLIYVDSSALVKLVRRESESPELADWMTLRDEAVSSALVSVELQRAVRRAGASAELLREAERQLRLITQIAIQRPILDLAGSLPDNHLRSLDAIHLATALSLGDLPDAFLTYDKRLATAAARHGLTVLHPGVDELEG